MDIGISHSPVTGLIVAGIGLVVIVVFILVLRFGFGQTTAPTTSVIRDHSVTHVNRQRG